MNFFGVGTALKNNLMNFPGWKTDRKIVVIESDDWGSICMPSRDVYNLLKNQGIKVDQNAYFRYDSLESEDDILLLLETLTRFTDCNGRSPVITVNMIVANPDFNSIRSLDYAGYKYEKITETYKSYPKHNESFTLLREGLNNKLLFPQLHGREHLNVRKWMLNLKEGNPDLLLAFNHKMISLPSLYTSENMNGYRDAFEVESTDEIQDHSEIIKDATRTFEELFGFQSKTIIPPCYIWTNKHEKIFKDNEIDFIQGISLQYEPLFVPGTLRYNKRFHFTGERNKLNQRYLVRNAFFEPSLNQSFDWVNDCLSRIETSFKWRKPAIIGTHRVNFMGYIEPSNRSRNLVLFRQLLSKLLRKWPDVEFMHTAELASFMVGAKDL